IWIVSGEHALAAGLSGDYTLFGIRVWSALNTRTHASVFVTDQHAAFLVDRSVKEVEQVSRHRAALESASANAVALHRTPRCRVNGRPGLAAVEGRRNVEIPGPGETRLVLITR